MAFYVALVTLSLLIFLNYLPVICSTILASIYERKLQNELQAIEDSRLFEKCRIVITEPLGTGEEPDGKIAFKQAMQNQLFAIKSIMNLMDDLN